MQESGLKSTEGGLAYLGIHHAGEVFWNLTPAELVEASLKNNEGYLTDTGALMCDTGKFTGRAPRDKYTVKDAETAGTIWWGDVNQPFDPVKFDQLQDKMVKQLAGRKIYVRDAYAGADENYRLRLRVINTEAWHNLFCHNMFIRPSKEELRNFDPTFTIINDPGFVADPAVDGTRQGNFVIVNFTKKMILIGGTGYAGEIKKGIFFALNYKLPQFHDVLSMHCSANVGKQGDTAIFFGMSGTGKTTLSADADRGLIGDDEHGWAETGVFNFEGGCYAKVVDLTRDNEPQIYDAIRFGAIVENTRFIPGTRTVDFTNTSVTQNTRTAYPIHYIDNAVSPSTGGVPKNIFFLTCDAHGVLPPIARLDKGQAMYHFISGYTAKVAGTETGITEPQTVFSACFGAPFLALHPTRYAEMLGKKMAENEVNIWLVNTGWSGGPYGQGARIRLKYTRAMIAAALEGALDNVSYVRHPVFGVAMPGSCPGVPSELLNPKNTWSSADDYDARANQLARAFNQNFNQYADYANDEILGGAPVATENVSN